METVLLTGITGFIGSHTAIQLLNDGYKVVGTTRNISRTGHIKDVIGKHTTKLENLTIVQADLTDDSAVWNTIMQGIDYVMHIASPLPRVMPKNPNDIIEPAKQGTLNVLKAAAANHVKRVVLTSSMAAIAYGKSKHKTFTEKDWSDEDNLKDSTPYSRSKTIAEKAAWAFINDYKGNPELSVINPGLVLGPVIDKNDYGTSVALVLKLMNGSFPAVPKIAFSLVDVRSVVDMHIKAMKSPAAAGERFICANSFMSISEIAAILKQNYPNHKIPKATLPHFLLKVIAKVDKQTAPVLVELNTERKHDNSKAKKLLNWSPYSDEQSIIDTAESLISLGLLKKR
jgi:dihydroflavonol-4-reductase